MAETPNLTKAAPGHGQMDRPYDPEERARMDREAPELAMGDGHNALAGSAAGVGSVEYDDPGAFDVGSGRRPQSTREGPVNTGPDGYDSGDPAELDRIRAGGLAPGEALPDDFAGSRPVEPLNRPTAPD